MPEEQVAVDVRIDLDMSRVGALEQAHKFEAIQFRMDLPSMHLQQRAFRRPGQRVHIIISSRTGRYQRGQQQRQCG